MGDYSVAAADGVLRSCSTRDGRQHPSQQAVAQLVAVVECDRLHLWPEQGLEVVLEIDKREAAARQPARPASVQPNSLFTRLARKARRQPMAVAFDVRQPTGSYPVPALAILLADLRLFRRHTPEPQPADGELPIPPLAMRELVGPREPEAFDHPRGQPLFPTLMRPEQYDFVLDFGCGCGRVARRLAVAEAPMPKRYVGIDLHAGMIAWANKNLASRLPGFTFIHQDVFNPGFNPDPSLPRTAPFPAEDKSVSLLLAMSVFTHLVQAQLEPYLDEVRRVLRPDGVMLATFFLFDKTSFPMMQDFQNSLYINDSDPTNAVIFDRAWLLAALDVRELRIREVRPPSVRGYHWELEIVPGRGSVTLPEDSAEVGREPPPVCSTPAYMIGETSSLHRRPSLRRRV